LQGLHWSRSIGSSFNVYAPKVYDVIHGGLIIDFIEGTPIDEFTKFSPKVFFNHFKAIGSILSLIHSNNYSFGDCKAENIFYNSKEKKYYFIDFEQFIKLKPQEYVRKVWDVTELFFYLGHNFPSSTSHDFLKKVIYIFLTRYYSDLFSSSQPNDYKNKMFTELGKLRYILIYATFMSPKTFFFILKTIQEWKNSFRLKWSKKIHGK
jgi:serine/threonine protein kinase